jgi:hypothetical protein
MQLRLSWGFPLGLASQRHPHKSSLGLLDYFTPTRSVTIFALGIFRLTINGGADRNRLE